jgi:hypothetical protein
LLDCTSSEKKEAEWTQEAEFHILHLSSVKAAPKGTISPEALPAPGWISYFLSGQRVHHRLHHNIARHSVTTGNHPRSIICRSILKFQWVIISYWVSGSMV